MQRIQPVPSGTFDRRDGHGKRSAVLRPVADEAAGEAGADGLGHDVRWAYSISRSRSSSSAARIRSRIFLISSAFRNTEGSENREFNSEILSSQVMMRASRSGVLSFASSEAGVFGGGGAPSTTGADETTFGLTCACFARARAANASR